MADRLRKSQVLLVDEVSMLSANIMDKLDFVARHVRGENDKPFGGLQVVMAGDFYQLPPVPSEDDDGLFCFSSPLWSILFPPSHCVILKKCIVRGTLRSRSFSTACVLEM